MAFDAFFMKAVLDEARAHLAEARVEKIHQPTRDTVVLHLKGKAGREKLLFSVNPTAPRVHLTALSPENPAQPPMFCMLLRKHLSGAKLSAITQLPMERWVSLTFDCTNELGDRVQKQLVAELMGRTCNLYLLEENGRICDCLRRVGLDESQRPALPGMFYTMPRAIEKANPAETENYVNFLEGPGADLLCDRLMDCFGGLSPLVCREAALYAAGSADARLEGADISAIGENLGLFFREHFGHPRPYVYFDLQGTPKQYAFCPLRQYGPCREYDTFGHALDEFYALRDTRDTMRQKGQAVRKTVQNLLTRLDKKLAIQEKELAATYDRERLRQLGDILTANLHRMYKGQTAVEVEDFYDEAMPRITVPLSPTLSPQQNAAKYYKDYSRMKNAEKELTRQIELGEKEREYLHSVAEELDRAGTEAELEEIRAELQAGGYLKADGKKRMKQEKPRPMEFTTTDGYRVLVGRNNRQNEELSFRLARKDDLWLHAQKVPGSHVIIACAGVTPPDDTVTQAAQLAAYYSAAREGRNVAVDVTAAGRLKHPGEGRPGMVIYHTYRTVYVNPYPEIIKED